MALPNIAQLVDSALSAANDETKEAAALPKPEPLTIPAAQSLQKLAEALRVDTADPVVTLADVRGFADRLRGFL